MENLVQSDYLHVPRSLSPDGKVPAFAERHPTTGFDLWPVPLKGDPEPSAFLVSQFDERLPTFSPDGEHFLMIKETNRAIAPMTINLVLNWFEELERLVPVE